MWLSPTVFISVGDPNHYPSRSSSRRHLSIPTQLEWDDPVEIDQDIITDPESPRIKQESLNCKRYWQYFVDRYQLQSRLISIPVVHSVTNKDHNNSTFILSSSSSSYWAELYQNGQVQLARIEEFLWPNEENHHLFREPKVRVTVLYPNPTQQINQETTVVDFGQITSIWNGDSEDLLYNEEWNKIATIADQVPTRLLERTFDRIHASTVRKGRSTTANPQFSIILTKKNIATETAESLALAGNGGGNFTLAATTHVESVLRKIQKTGLAFARLVDSQKLQKAIFVRTNQKMADGSLRWRQRTVAALLLARDAKLGGRFKRWPVVFLGMIQNSSSSVLWLLNGGYSVLDQSVRAQLEAQKMISRRESATDNFVASDDRILRRLECLAMGETKWKHEHEPQDSENSKLHLDVKRVLSSMQLPITPDGARTALVNLGRWSLSSLNNHNKEPWPSHVLEAAREYVQFRNDGVGTTENNRIDLTRFPCICIDAKSTTFRDDAVGIRPRMGRPLVPEASQWEILIHIADVSDIYAQGIPETKHLQPSLELLREAARHRGTSRYDLPLGPLHLLPPVVLQTLGLSRKKQSQQRAVTLYAYVDERDGRLLDVGIERSHVAKPLELTYSVATAILDNKFQNSGQGDNLERDNVAKTRTILLKLEQILTKWSQRRQERSETARKKEARFWSREEAAKQPTSDFRNSLGNDNYYDDDEDYGEFRRTRAHRLVDTALDLYGYSARRLLNRAKVPIPAARGAGLGGRVATAPLRRYIDGECQRQLLAALLKFGSVMDEEECRRAGRIANESRNKIVQVKAEKR